MKTLILIRHAKSSWKYEGLQDCERPLNNRGRRDAPLMAKHLTHQKLVFPSLMVSSHANRALTTAREFACEIGYPLECLQLSEHVYEATAGTLLDFISELSDQHQCVALFGHNQGLMELINTLVNDDVAKLPTTGIAAIELPIKSWMQIVEGASSQAGKLVYFGYPKLAKKLSE